MVIFHSYVSLPEGTFWLFTIAMKNNPRVNQTLFMGMCVGRFIGIQYDIMIYDDIYVYIYT